MSDFNIDMTGKDYLSLLTIADNYAKELAPEWTSRDANDLNWVTIKTIAYLISIGTFYIDLSFNEKDPFEVKIYKNALKLAKAQGMPVRKYCGAVVDVRVGIVTNTVQLVIPRGTQFFAGSMPFVLVESTVIIANSTLATLSLQYGTFERKLLGYSDGTSYQKFIIDDTTVQNDSVEIAIDESSLGEVVWDRVDSLVMSFEIDTDYKMILTEDEKYEVSFGDNQCGHIPVDSSPIYADCFLMPSTYVADNYGNIPAGNITVSTDVNITIVTQSLAAVGGQDKETLLEIGRNLPQWVSTANRAVTLRDYEYLARRIPGVGFVRAIQVDLLIELYVVPTGGGYITTALGNRILAYINDRKQEQITVHILSPDEIGVNATISIVVDSTRNRAEIRENATTAVEAFINRLTSVGISLTVMDLYDTLKAVEGVISSKVTYFYREEIPPQLDDVTLDYDETTIVGTLTMSATGGIV